MTARSDIEHWQINATVYKDRVEEIHYITDPARNIRRKPQTKVWKIEQFLGRGGFGESKEAGVFVDFFGWFKDGSDVFLAMEYVPLGDLETNVVAHSGKVPEVEAQDITQQILLGLEIMHAGSFAHRDLKPQNVLVVHGPPQWWVKLADFGLSKRLTETTAYHTKGGTQSYMAPEVLDYDVTDISGTEYTNAVDLWAVGCITFRLVTGVVPFPSGKSLWKYCEDQSLFPYGPCFDSGIKSSCFEFIKGLLETRPKKRPSASQALAHAWVSLGSNAGRRSIDHLRSIQETPRLLESTVSDIDYNTVPHAGLKSYRLPSPPHTDYPENRSASNTSSSKSGSIEEQVSTEEGATLSELKLDEAVSDNDAAERANPGGSTYAYSNVEDKTNLWSREQSPSPESASPQPIPPHASIRSSTDDKTVKAGAVLRILAGHEHYISSVTIAPNGNMLASGSYDHTIRLWDVATGVTLHVLTGHKYAVREVTFSPNSKVVASSSYDDTVRLWDTATGIALQTLDQKATIHSMTFSPNGNVLASSSGAHTTYGPMDHMVQLWDVATGTLLQKLRGHKEIIYSISYSPDGNVVASGSRDRTVKLWDVATGTLLQTLEGHTNEVFSVAFSPDGNVVASGSGDKTVRLWDMPTGGTLLQTLEGYKHRVTGVVFSPNGCILASVAGDDGVDSFGSDHTVRLWDTATGTLLRMLKGHKSEVTSVAFSPDGNVAVTGSLDKTLKLWDVATGNLLQTLKGHQREVRSVAFSTDGNMLAFPSLICRIWLWDVSTVYGLIAPRPLQRSEGEKANKRFAGSSNYLAGEWANS
ncbi:hypothetical protein V492_08376 [Pseudogymnoascus sp. VKM F-4246]|nr:hypothetical protein V492_08376 [Pseudogymnoascus sp. VKM F-4246]